MVDNHATFDRGNEKKSPFSVSSREHEGNKGLPRIYSHSRLSCFEQCPHKFKLKYIDKIIPEIEKTIEAHLGNCVHDALEWLYNEVRSAGKPPSVNELIEAYINSWEKNYKSEIKIVRGNLKPKDYFNKGIEFLMNYFTKHYPFADSTIECEKKITINLDSKGDYKVQGFIDRLVYNIENNLIEIHDYKTANSLPSKDKIEADRQLALYSIAIKEIYGDDKEVLLVWHYLAHNTKIISRRTNEQLNNLKKETLDLIKKIESMIEFPANKSVLCDWCEYKTMCYVFGGKPNEKQKKIEHFNANKKILNDETELDIW